MDERRITNLNTDTLKLVNTIVGHQNWDRYVDLAVARYPTHSQLPVTMDRNSTVVTMPT